MTAAARTPDSRTPDSRTPDSRTPDSRTPDSRTPDMRGCDSLDDVSLCERFESLTIRPADFRHREHVRLAFAMLQGADFGEAAVRYRRALKRFAEHVGAPGKYHETLTWAHLAIVHQRMHELPCATSFELLERAPELLDHRNGALARHYDVAAITASPLARAVLVLPDR